MLILLLGYFIGLIFGIVYFFNGLNTTSYLFVNDQYGRVESRITSNFKFNNNLIGVVYCLVFFVAGLAILSSYFSQYFIDNAKMARLVRMSENDQIQKEAVQQTTTNQPQSTEAVVENVDSVWSTEKVQMTN